MFTYALFGVHFFIKSYQQIHTEMIPHTQKEYFLLFVAISHKTLPNNGPKNTHRITDPNTVTKTVIFDCKMYQKWQVSIVKRTKNGQFLL